MAMTRAEALAAVALRYPTTTPAPKQPAPPLEPQPLHQLSLFPELDTANPQPGADHAVTH